MSKEAALAMVTGTQASTPAVESVQAPLAEALTPEKEAMDTPPVPTEMESSFLAKKAKWEQERIKKELELKKEREQILEARKLLGEFEEKKKSNPIEAIKLLGLTEADFFNYAAEVAKPELTPEEKAIQAATEATEAKLKAYEEELQKKQAQAQAEKDEQAMTAYKKAIASAFEANKEKYKFSASIGDDPEGLALAYVTEVFKESGGKELLTIEEALAETEEYYKNDWLMKEAKLKPPAPPSPQEGSQEMAKKEPERTRTVTASDPSQTPKPVVSKTRTLNNGATATLASLTQKRESLSEKKARIIKDIAEGRLERYSK